jgi:hypothetical protein
MGKASRDQVGIGKRAANAARARHDQAQSLDAPRGYVWEGKAVKASEYWREYWKRATKRHTICSRHGLMIAHVEFQSGDVLHVNLYLSHVADVQSQFGSLDKRAAQDTLAATIFGELSNAQRRLRNPYGHVELMCAEQALQTVLSACCPECEKARAAEQTNGEAGQ